MVITTAATVEDCDENFHSSTFARRLVRHPLPKFKMPERSIPKEASYQIISDDLMLDGNPRLNLASFVTSWMEPECEKLMMASTNKNYVDVDEYPVTTELQNRCVNMIAHLFNASVEDSETAVGVWTVGSSEAIMLAGLTFKRKWQQRRKPWDTPNIVTGANMQGYKDIMQNCMENARILRQGIQATERFHVLSKDMRVPLVAFSLRDSSRYTVFDLSETLRRFGWIVPAYTMPADAQHVAVLRVVVREDFGWSLAERLVQDLCKVIREMETRADVHPEMDVNSVGGASAKKSDEQIQREVTTHWRKFVVGKKPGIC